MDKKINILVVPSDFSGVGKFRSIGPAVYIQEHYSDEFNVDIVPVQDFPKEKLDEWLKQYDIIHYHKQLDKKGTLLGLIKFLGIKAICDIDDHYLLGNDHPMSITARKEKWHEPIVNHLRKSDYVTTTTHIFANEIKKHNPNVVVFPNAIDVNEKQFSTKKNQSDKIRIGIVCGSTHLHDLERLNNIAGKLTNEELNKVQFVLCGFDTNGTVTSYDASGNATTRNIRPEESVWFKYEKMITDNYKIVSPEHRDFLLKFIKVDDPFVNEPYRRMWTRNINSYGTHYENVDILLAPLKENEFNKMKSQLKEVEAGFTNTALIAEDFGAYTIDLVPLLEKGNLINENGTALLVAPGKDHKNWAKYIQKLIANPELIDKLKSNLHDYVIDKYSLEKVCEKRVEFYRGIYNGKN